MTEHLISSSTGDFPRRAWLCESGETNPEKFAIFLDGEFYLDGMGAAAMIERLRDEGEIPAIPVLFLSHRDLATRHHELSCDERFAAFVTTEVVAWLRRRYPSLAPGDHLLVGPSLGGLQATFITLNHPEIFSRCLSHSGSYWWKSEWLKDELARMTGPPGRFWLSVGDRETASGITHRPTGMRQEVSQRDACERFSAALSDRGHEVHFHLFEGAHEFSCWAAELPGALRWLLK